MKDSLNVRDRLTNESLRGLFKSNFELTNQAIRLARFYLRSGHEITMGKLLSEVKRNPSEQYLNDLMAMEEEDSESHDERG